MSKYLWQSNDWPNLVCGGASVSDALARASFSQGKLLGELNCIGFELKARAGFESLSTEIVESAAIEGESIDLQSVRSSVARRMDIVLNNGENIQSGYGTEARVDMMMDATRKWMEPMTLDRLKSWHAALFPTGYSGLTKIGVGSLRTDKDGPMRVVSRYGSLERVHFVAPPAETLPAEMDSFLQWLAMDSGPAMINIALAHLRFLTLHPFDDGNGRIARALTEYLLARLERTELRFYSVSAQIQREKSEYYREIEHAQRNSTDVSRWVEWFLSMYCRALESSRGQLDSILFKAQFWREHSQGMFNEHQRRMLNSLLDGFEGNLTSSKWALICKISQDTASREIKDLIARGILVQLGTGRSTHFVLNR